MATCKITFCITMDEEDIIALARSKGWSEKIQGPEGDIIDSSETASEYAVRLARKNMANFLGANRIAEINKAKEVARKASVEALEKSIDDSITETVEEVTA